MQTDITEILKAIILRNTIQEIPYESLDNDTDLVNDLALDSIAVVNLFADIEAEFKIEMDVTTIKTPILDKFRFINEYVQECIRGNETA